MAKTFLLGMTCFVAVPWLESPSRPFRSHKGLAPAMAIVTWAVVATKAVEAFFRLFGIPVEEFEGFLWRGNGVERGFVSFEIDRGFLRLLGGDLVGKSVDSAVLSEHGSRSFEMETDICLDALVVERLDPGIVADTCTFVVFAIARDAVNVWQERFQVEFAEEGTCTNASETEREAEQGRQAEVCATLVFHGDVDADVWPAVSPG